MLDSDDFFDIAKLQNRRHRDTFIRWRNSERHLDEEQKIHCVGKSRVAAILRVPAEVMADIFKYSQLVSCNSSGENRENLDWCWLTITHVCTYWRNIAVHAQGLWSCIDIENHACLEQTETYLRRSRVSTLSVYFNDQESSRNRYARECIKSVIHHMHRIRELHLQNVQHIEFFHELFTNPAPALENFSLHTVLMSSGVLDFKSLLAGSAPKLTSLSLCAFVSTWENIPIIKNLRYLHITSPLSLQNLISIVSQNSNFEELRMTCVKISLPKYTNDQQHIQLSSLKNLVLHQIPCPILFQLFQYIDIPESSWDISCINFPIKTQPPADPKCLIPRTSRNDRRFPKLKLFVSRGFVKIVANSNDEAQVRQRSVTYPFLEPGVTISDTFDLIGSVIRGEFWCSAIELTVEIVSFNPDYRMTTNTGGEVWTPLLKLFPELCKMIIRLEDHFNFSSVIGLLNALGGHTEMTGNCEVICPNLTELHLCGFHLFNREGVERAVETLRRRSQHGKQLSLLRVTNVQSTNLNLPDESLRLLQESGIARMIEIIV